MQRRGIIQVKGKGNMETYFIGAKSDKLKEEELNGELPPTLTDPAINKSSSLAEVMFNMVQTIKKQNLANSLSVPSSSKSKLNRLSLSFNSKQSTLSNLASVLPLRGSSAHSTRSAIIGDYNQMKSSSCKLHRIKSEKPSRKFTSKRKYMSKARLSDGFTELNTNGGHNLLEYARNQAAVASTSADQTNGNNKAATNQYSSNDKLIEKKSSLKISRQCRSVSPTIEEQIEDKRNSKIDYL